MKNIKFRVRGIPRKKDEFRGSILRDKPPNSVARLEILRSAENCGPYWWYYKRLHFRKSLLYRVVSQKRGHTLQMIHSSSTLRTTHYYISRYDTSYKEMHISKQQQQLKKHKTMIEYIDESQFKQTKQIKYSSMCHHGRRLTGTGGGRSTQNLRWGRPMYPPPQYFEKQK